MCVCVYVSARACAPSAYVKRETKLAAKYGGMYSEDDTIDSNIHISGCLQSNLN